MLQTAHGKEALSNVQLYRWFSAFKDRPTSVDDYVQTEQTKMLKGFNSLINKTGSSLSTTCMKKLIFFFFFTVAVNAIYWKN